MRKPQRPTETQKQIIDILIKELRSWKNTNDIASPTHHSDLRAFLQIVDTRQYKLEFIARNMDKLLKQIRSI